MLLKVTVFAKCRRVIVGSLLAVVIACLNACAVNPVTGSRDMVLVTEEQEIEELGEKSHPHVLKAYGGEYKDPELLDYITAVGNRLARVSHRQDLIYHFTILDTPMINAFATPGYIYVTRGMLAYFNSEAELAGVLGHEMGHITARHGVRQHAKSTLANLLASVIAQSAGSGFAGDASQLLGAAIIRGYGREYELEADRLGGEYLAKSGYDPQAILSVLRILKDQEEFEKQRAEDQDREPNIYHGLFATHPDSDTRLQEIIAEAEKFQTLPDPEINRQAYLDRIDGMVYGPSKRQGTVRGNKVYYTELETVLTFPEGWTIANRTRSARANNTQDTAAVVVAVEDRNRKQNARDFLEKRFKGAKPESGQALESSLDGWTAVAHRMKTPYGTAKIARVAVVMTDYRIFKFIGATKDADDFAAMDPLFLDAMQKTRAMEPDEYELAKPRSVRIYQVQEGDTFAGLAKETSISNYAEETLRLINGKYPDGELEEGMMIKVID